MTPMVTTRRSSPTRERATASAAREGASPRHRPRPHKLSRDNIEDACVNLARPATFPRGFDAFVSGLFAWRCVVGGRGLRRSRPATDARDGSGDTKSDGNASDRSPDTAAAAARPAAPAARRRQRRRHRRQRRAAPAAPAARRRDSGGTGGTGGGVDGGPDAGGSDGGAPTCSDGIKNSDETGIDCGGHCGKCGARQSVSRQRRLHVLVQGGQDLRRVQRRRRLLGQRIRVRAPHLHRRRLRQHARGRGHRADGADHGRLQAPPVRGRRHRRERQRRHRRARGPQPVHQRHLHVGSAVAHDDARELQLRRRQPLQRERPVRRVRGRRGLPGDRHRLPHANLHARPASADSTSPPRTPSSSTRPRATARGCSATAPATRRSSTTTPTCRSTATSAPPTSAARGTPSHRPVASGTTCGGSQVCDGANNCVECLSATTCPGTDTDCHTRSCVSGACGITNIAAGTLVAAQTPRDCKKNVCNGQGTSGPVSDDLDLPVDGNAVHAGRLHRRNAEQSVRDRGQQLRREHDLRRPGRLRHLPDGVELPRDGHRLPHAHVHQRRLRRRLRSRRDGADPADVGRLQAKPV